MKYKYRLQIVCSERRSKSDEKKEGWRICANNLNTRFLPGKVVAVPGNIVVLKMCL